jgi:hypothetical protein
MLWYAQPSMTPHDRILSRMLWFWLVPNLCAVLILFSITSFEFVFREDLSETGLGSIYRVIVLLAAGSTLLEILYIAKELIWHRPLSGFAKIALLVVSFTIVAFICTGLIPNLQ